MRGQTPLIIATIMNCTKAAKELFNAENTPLHPILLNDDINSKDVIIVNGETINIRTCVLLDATDEYGNTALHYCSFFGNKELASFLINKGARTTVLNNEADSPVALLAKLPSGYNCPIYTEVYEPLLEMQWQVPEIEMQQFFPEEEPIGLGDDLLLI